MKFYRSENVAYFSPSKNFVNRLPHNCFPARPRIENKEVDSLSRWWNARLARLFTDGFVENLRTAEEISAAEILRRSPQRCFGHLRAA